ncbi:MAG TPA: hypothetical protein VGR71_02265, partial [Nitrospira sp.]|nr:hypothetical protein [Nitrospira sp.]
LALSHITHYRLSDWLKVFGLDLDRIFRLQLLIPRRRTILLDSTVHDTYAWIPWFADRPHFAPAPAIAPLGYFLASAPPRRAEDLLALNVRRFRYAVVGDQDFYALPYFAPGSIIRVDTLRVEELQLGRNPNEGGLFFLVEHDHGWTCSRLTPLGKDRVLLNCPQRPCTEREFHIGRDARILGVVDAELHPLHRHHPRGSMQPAAMLRERQVGHLSGERANLKDLLRRSRMSLGLSLREASSISRFIADALADELYFAAASTLSDYEAITAPPRHIQKVITLCLLYCIGFHEFLRASTLPLNQAGREPMPDELVPRLVPGGNHGPGIAGQGGVGEPSGLLPAFVSQWEEVPLCLRFSLDEICGLKGFSISDVFWVGGVGAQRHPSLINATFVAVNRRSRKPSPREESVCKESLYLVLKRDGSYLCGRCTLDGGSLVVYGYPRSPDGTQRFRNGTEAEVVGQITAILRRLP